MVSSNETIQDHQSRLNRVLLYIQEHLEEPLRLEKLAGVACFSPFHFHRIFAAYVHETLNAHVRRLRLERAAAHLCQSRRAVTDIALSAGYETPGAFTKAFAQHFGESPTSFRKRKTTGLRLERRLVITLKKEEDIMKPDIRKQEDLRVMYVRRTGSYHAAATEAWQALCAFAGPRGLLGPKTRCIGIGHDDPAVTPEEKLRYDACVSIGPDVKGQGEVGVQTLPGGTYAVFTHKGSYDGLNGTYQEIFGQWLPSSGKALREAPCFELYVNSPEHTPPEKLLTEIWVPLQ